MVIALWIVALKIRLIGLATQRMDDRA